MAEALTSLTATEAHREITRGALSSEEYVTACLDQIEALDGDIRAFVHIDRAHALKQARELDEWRRDGRPTGPLHGIPVAIKDIFDTRDYPTECGSPLLAGRRPRQDSTVVAKLRAAGAVIIGKTVTTEFAYYHPGPTRNPHNLEHTPGGSSSGSAAAVAAGMVPLAIGSQTNGSVIRPASFCGVFGAKPTHGFISRGGALELSRTLDHVGVFARTLEDVALLLDVLTGHDPLDPDTKPVAKPNFRAIAAEPPPLPPKFALVKTPVWEKADVSTREIFEELISSLGDDGGIAELPDIFAEAWDAQRMIMAADMAHRFSKLVERGSPDASSKQLRELLDEGRRVTAVDYLAAHDLRPRLHASLAPIFDYYDAIITPASIGSAPASLETTGDPVFCTLWTLLGVPALSLPVLQAPDGMPLGLQLVGPPNDDARLLRSARVLLENLSKLES